MKFLLPVCLFLFGCLTPIQWKVKATSPAPAFCFSKPGGSCRFAACDGDNSCQINTLLTFDGRQINDDTWVSKVDCHFSNGESKVELQDGSICYISTVNLRVR